MLRRSVRHVRAIERAFIIDHLCRGVIAHAFSAGGCA
jgi:hypothetical protein